MNNILSLINPARIIKVEDAMKVTESLIESNPSIMKFDGEREATALSLLQSFESLYALKLEKGHFVPPAKPDSKDFIDDTDFAYAWKDYQTALNQLIFEGFEETPQFHAELKGTDFGLFFNQWDGYTQDNTDLWFDEDNSMIVRGATIGDLLYHISKYNETAATPIELKYTSNIFSLLKIEG